VRFATPICFEDTFGYLNREFVRRGADVLVNMTNDAWSASEVCEIQHAVMAVFRAVENKRAVVRSTNGGITCIIDPNGKIVSKLEPFVADYLVGLVPVVRNVTTPYTRWGDWLGPVSIGLALGCIAIGLVKFFLTRRASKAP
jgi:apolipoprotein N-acyltransferase